MQEEEEEGNQRYPFRRNMIMDDKPNLVIQIMPERTLEVLEHRWRGEMWKEEEGAWVKDPNQKPTMNDEGVDTIIATLRPIVSQNASLSNLEPKEIESQTLLYAKGLMRMLAVNSKKWGMNKSARTAVAASVVSLVHNVLCRNLGRPMSDKEVLSTTIRSQESNIIRMAEQKKKGFFSFMKSRKFGGQYGGDQN